MIAQERPGRTVWDETPKRHTTITASADLDANSYYIGGSGSDDCGPVNFIARLSSNGEEVSSTTFAGLDIGLPSHLIPADGDLFAAARHRPSDIAGDPHYIEVYRLDLAAENIIWNVRFQDYPSASAALEFMEFNQELLLVYFRAAANSTTVLALIEKSTGTVAAEYSFTSEYDGGIHPLNVDAAGNISVNLGDRIMYLDGKDFGRADEIWSLDVQDVEGLDLFDSFIPVAADDIYVSSAGARIHQLNAADGELNSSFTIEGNSETALAGAMLGEWPFVYYAPQREDSDGNLMRAAKINLEGGSTVWIGEFETPGLITVNSTIARSPQNDLVLAGVNVNSQISTVWFDVEDGARKHRGTWGNTGTEETGVFVNRVGSELIYSVTQAGEIGNGNYHVITAFKTTETGARTGGPLTYGGRYKIEAIVKKMLPFGQTYVELIQAGPIVEVIMHAVDKTGDVWRTVLPRNNNIEEGLAMAVSDGSNIAVVTRSKSLSLNEFDDEPPRFLTPLDIDVLHFYYLNSSGDILNRHTEVLEFVALSEVDLYAVNEYFFATMTGSHQDGTSIDVLRLGSENVENVSLDLVPPPFLQQGATQLFGFDDHLFVGGRIPESTDCRLVKIHYETLDVSEVVQLTDCEDIITTVAKDNRAVIVGSFWDRGQDLQSSELFHVDLADAQNLWRRSFDESIGLLSVHYSQDGSRIYTLGGKIHAEQETFSILLTCLDADDGATIWTYDPGIDGGEHLLPLDMEVIDDQIVIAGLYYLSEKEVPRNSFLLSLDTDGNFLGSRTLEDKLTIELFRTKRGDLLHSVARYANPNDCFLSGKAEVVDLVVDVKQVTHLDQLQVGKIVISPNPADGACSLVFPGVAGRQYSIIVRDLLGRTVLRTQASLRDSETGLRLEAQNLGRGVFSVEIQGTAEGLEAERYEGILVRR